MLKAQINNMKHLRINKAHEQTLESAREIAKQWQLEGEQKWQLECDYQMGENQDVVSFKRSGAVGMLSIDEVEFRLEMELGFLLRPYKKQIEEAILNNLDDLLKTKNTG